MRFVFLLFIPICFIICGNYFLSNLVNKELANTFTGVIVGGLITFYTTSTFEGLKYRINEKNNYLRILSKMDSILNNNLKNLIHNSHTFEEFDKNLTKLGIHELYIYPFIMDLHDYLNINDIEIIKKIADCLIYFEHLDRNLNILKNYYIKLVPHLEITLASNKLDEVNFLLTEFKSKTSSLRIIIKDSINETYKFAIETISFLQAQGKRVSLSKKENFIFGDISNVYVKPFNNKYLEKRRNTLLNNYKL